MNTKRILYTLLTVVLLTACTDEIEQSRQRLAGYLYFNVSENASWKEEGKTRGGVEAPILMESSLEGQPIYLHTEVSATATETTTENSKELGTRGVRYTGDVFTPSTTGDASHPKISSFGVYATRTADRGVILDYAKITPSTSESATTSGWDHYKYDWNVKEQEIEGVWDSGTADFYGYAPYFTNPSSDNGLSMAANGNGVPTLTYTVPTDVTKQLDILTAKHTGVSKGSDVELEFSHVMSAIKFNFKYGRTPDGAGSGTDKDNFKWNDGVNTYNVTVTNVLIKNVYYKEGTWTLGDDPYNGGKWSRTNTEKLDFAYAPSKALSDELTSPVELNPDAAGNVFMMLPQQVPDDATIEITCNLTKEGDSEPTKTMTLSAALKETDGTTAKTWLPGYTYTYTISLSDFAYVFDFDTSQDYDATTPTANASAIDPLKYTNISFDGHDSYPLMIRSYRIDSNNNKEEVSWTICHEETVTEGDIESEAGATTKTVETPGLPDWMVLYEGANDTKGSKVTETTHTGAIANAEARKFFMEIRSIEYPVIDLSLYGFDQTTKRNIDPTKTRYTANCYVVSGPGTYRIPLVYGNAISKGVDNKNAYLSKAVIANPSLDTSGDAAAGVRYLNRLTNHAGASIGNPYINKVTNGLAKNGSAVLVWEETENLIQNLSLDFTHVGEDGYNSDGDQGYLQFTVKPGVFNYGNAVVGVKGSDNNICWSWHIWITDPATVTTHHTLDIKNDHSVTFAGCNVGWVDKQSEQAPLTREGKIILRQNDTNNELKIDATQLRSNAFTPYLTNTLYQWGRKDPMRGIVSNGTDRTNDGARRATTGIAYTNAYPAQVPISTMIQNPNTIYGVSRGDLYTHSYYNLWGMNCTQTKLTYSYFGKTIYDPCPVGYCVPPSKAFSKLTKSKFAEEDGSKFDASKDEYATCTYTDDKGTITFPVAGIRSSDGTYQLRASGYWGGTHATAYYQSASPYSADENWGMRLDIYSGIVIDTHVGNFKPDHSTAGAIRPAVYKGEKSATENEDIYMDLPLTFKVTAGSGTISWKNWYYSTGKKYITYVKNGGEPKTVQSDADDAVISVTTDDVLEFYMYEEYDDGVAYGLNSTQYNYFAMSGTGLQVEAYGNIMSLVSDDYETWTTIPLDYAFSNLFNSCSALTSVENLRLPAMTLKQKCYNEMFKNCTGITKAPILPAETLVSGCYDGMFNGCTNLNWVKALFLTDPVRTTLGVKHYDYTDNWLNGVKSLGTFVRNASATWDTSTRNANTVPSGWSITTTE